MPCGHGRILDAFWPLLETFDPDIVYSYVPLTRADILDLHERIYPSEYILHERQVPPRLSVFGFKPDYRFPVLDALSAVFAQARHAQAFLPILDCWFESDASRFLTDNFGTYHTSMNTNMFPTDALPAARLLSIVPPEKAEDRRLAIDPNLAQLPNELEAFRALAEKRATAMSFASLWHAPHLEIRHGDWSSSFSLVIGNTFADRILHWNSRLFIPNWLGHDLCCLRIDAAHLSDPDFREVLARFLQRHNHVNSGSGGQSRLTVRSLSLSPEELEKAGQTICELRPWGPVAVSHMTGLDEILPASRSLEEARSHALDARLFGKPGWTQFWWSGTVARPPTVAPSHLADAPPRQKFIRGWWAVDFIISHDGPLGRFAQENVWCLPRRWRLASAFFERRLRSSDCLPPRPRCSRGGHLTAGASLQDPIESLRPPDARGALAHALVRDGLPLHPDGEHAAAYPLPRIAWCAPSNEDSYLTGVLGMAGGLEAAMSFLLHPFLRDQLARLGATPNASAHDTTDLSHTLNKRIARGHGVLDLTHQDDLEFLKDLVLKEARRLRSPNNHLRYDDLRESWKSYVTEFWEGEGHQRDNAEGECDWDRSEECASLDLCLQALRARKMLFQGHQWICSKCAHRNWVDLAGLSPELLCEVCQEASVAPVDIAWLFRPNEFLVKILRDHSALSLLWALSVLRGRARHSFIFVGPTRFGYDYDGESTDTEADLLVCADGRALLVEVKNSWRAVGKEGIPSLIALAKKLRPDSAVLAVMESGQKRQKEIAAARADLGAANIGLEILTQKADEPDPFLPWSD